MCLWTHCVPSPTTGSPNSLYPGLLPNSSPLCDTTFLCSKLCLQWVNKKQTVCHDAIIAVGQSNKTFQLSLADFLTSTLFLPTCLLSQSTLLFPPSTPHISICLPLSSASSQYPSIPLAYIPNTALSLHLNSCCLTQTLPLSSPPNSTSVERPFSSEDVALWMRHNAVSSL